jgi:hypothetical protein
MKELIVIPMESPRSAEKGFENESLPHQAEAQGSPGRLNRTRIRINKKLSLIPTKLEEIRKTKMKNMAKKIEETCGKKPWIVHFILLMPQY